MFYTRVGNEDLLLQKLNNERTKKGYIKISKINKDKSNLKKQITQKINYIIKKQEKGQANIIDIENLKLLKEQQKELEQQTNEKA
jgi:low affinity Fe/Cu permease